MRCRHKPKHVTSVLLARFSDFDRTMGFYCSYMLLLKLPVLMCSCPTYYTKHTFTLTWVLLQHLPWYLLFCLMKVEFLEDWYIHVVLTLNWVAKKKCVPSTFLYQHLLNQRSVGLATAHNCAVLLEWYCCSRVPRPHSLLLCSLETRPCNEKSPLNC